MTFYLKYRPQTLDEIIGQDQVKKTLSSAYQNNKLSHAYLFVGPRGTGKTSTARILAKMVNCESQESSDYPCNKCTTCLSITDGSNLDLIEIDAASNRGIEDIRSLRERIKLAPTSSRKKVYIIDEVHMLTPEAFNALLKTLEEPPSHVLFILATTELGKIPATILSRVQRLDFKLATPDELHKVLEKIAKEEKIDIEKEASEILIRKAEGSFRDVVKLLDQVASSGKITPISLQEDLRSIQFEDAVDFLTSLSQKKLSETLGKIAKVMEVGVDIKDFTNFLMELQRDLMLIKNGLGEQLVKGKWSEERYQKLVKLQEEFTGSQLMGNLQLLQDSLEKLKFTSILSLPLELVVVEICTTSSVIPSGSEESHEEKLDVRSEKLDKSDSTDILKIKEKWTFILETIRPYNFSLEALLRSASITECTDSTVVMEVPYSFHQRILDAPKNRDLLEGILSDVLGRAVKVSTILGTRPAKREDIANIEVAADDEIIRIASEIFNSEPSN